MTMSPATIDIFGFRVNNTSRREAAETILDRAEKGIREKVCFVNAHCVNTAAKNPEYCEILSRMDRVFADGMGLAIATRVAGLSLVDNINGTDLFPVLCEFAAERGTPIAFLGSHPEVAKKCAARMRSHYPGLNIVFVQDGYFDQERDEEIVEKLNRSGARVLLVARGVPRQEMWIDKFCDRLEAPQILAVGGLFDFYSGRLRRAPMFMRKLGLEWLVRLIQEPRRLFKRYVFGNPLFIFRTFRLRIQGRSSLRKRLT